MSTASPIAVDALHSSTSSAHRTAGNDRVIIFSLRPASSSPATVYAVSVFERVVHCVSREIRLTCSALDSSFMSTDPSPPHGFAKRPLQAAAARLVLCCQGCRLTLLRSMCLVFCCRCGTSVQVPRMIVLCCKLQVATACGYRLPLPIASSAADPCMSSRLEDSGVGEGTGWTQCVLRRLCMRGWLPACLAGWLVGWLAGP